tara:strand:+ start:119 stop:328 length:210 start_codon:yes stop_codon:yes gene_type:complete
MQLDIRGSITKLKKLARSKAYAEISDRLFAVIYSKKMAFKPNWQTAQPQQGVGVEMARPLPKAWYQRPI